MPTPLKKGDTNEDFGLKVETDFHIVTDRFGFFIKVPCL
jgi:hypothetical protein